MKRHLTLLSLIAGFFLVGTNIAFAAQSLENIIIDFSFFLRNVILPFLISLAFLYFLINMTKYFIIQGDSDEGRTKAKRSAIYGIAAFVFLFSLWGIVAIIVQGVLGNTYQEDSLCPDYLDGFCGDTTAGGGPTGATFPEATPGASGTGVTSGAYTGNGNTGGSGNGNTGGSYTGTGNGNTGGSGGNNTSGGTNVTNTAKLAELVFGTGKDSASFTTYTGDPRSAFNAPIISETATCEDGLNALTLASNVETTQAAYLLYKNAAGITRWKNLTDLNSTNHIGYDKDVLESVLAENIQKPHIVHTHPKSRATAQGLVMSGHGPSAADMRAMCELNDTQVTYLTADWSGVWRMRQQSDTCPYTASAQTVLPLLETYNDLASLDSSQRAGEILKYSSSPLVADTYKNHFNALNADSFSSYTPEEIIGLASPYQTYASTTIAYSQSIADFCNTY